jgi:hypothetical protein
MCTPNSTIHNGGNASPLLNKHFTLIWRCFRTILDNVYFNAFGHSGVEPVVGSNIFKQNGDANIRQRRREQYSAMTEVQKDILLTKKREYYKRSKVARECPSNVAFLSLDGTTQDPDRITINQSESYQLTKCTDPVETPPHKNNTANYKRTEMSPDNGQATQIMQSNFHSPMTNT